MHIAICDDNTADRKQLERLLKRESDKRAATTGIIYADSFGNAPMLLANPMQYDAFYIDMCKTEGVTGMDVVRELTKKGVNAPIVMCSSDINYREQNFPDNVIFLDKPIKADELSASIDHAHSIMEKAEPLIELREDKETYYVTESDIMYAVENGLHVVVSLTDGRKISLVSTAMNFFSQIESHPSFVAPSMKVVLNGRYIEKIGFHKATMTDGSKFSIHRDCMKYTKHIFDEYHKK